MPEMAKLIRLERRGVGGRVLIDGQEFPWHIAADGVGYTFDPESVPVVQLTLLAERIEVDDDFSPAQGPAEQPG